MLHESLCSRRRSWSNCTDVSGSKRVWRVSGILPVKICLPSWSGQFPRLKTRTETTFILKIFTMWFTSNVIQISKQRPKQGIDFNDSIWPWNEKNNDFTGVIGGHVNWPPEFQERSETTMRSDRKFHANFWRHFLFAQFHSLHTEFFQKYLVRIFLENQVSVSKWHCLKMTRKVSSYITLPAWILAPKHLKTSLKI